MLKNSIISIVVAVAAIGAAAVTSVVIKRNSNTILSQNVEALMEQEHTTGTCEEVEGACIGRCPGCGQLVEAMGIHHGPAKSINHCR